MTEEFKNKTFNERQKLAFWLARAAAEMRAAIVDKIAANGHELSAEQFDVLELLWRQKGQPVSQRVVAEQLRRSPPAVSRLLDSLELKNLVRREAIDKRTNAVFLTDAGEKLHSHLGPILDALVQGKLSDISDADLLATTSTLRRLSKRA